MAVICFHNPNEENGYLSNWYESPFVIDDFCYLSVEQYLMAQKAKLFHDAENYTAILKSNSPKECKALGRKVTPFDSDLWDKVRYDVLKNGIRAKFSQNSALKTALLATGDSIIAEASPYDGIFGIKLSAQAAEGMAPGSWPGRNLLGRALMEIREELRPSADIADIINSSVLDSINRILRNGGTC